MNGRWTIPTTITRRQDQKHQIVIELINNCNQKTHLLDEGEWNDDIPNDQGKYAAKDGSVIEGTWDYGWIDVKIYSKVFKIKLILSLYYGGRGYEEMSMI